MNVLSLRSGRRSMVFARGRFFGCRGAGAQTSAAPVIADAIDGRVVDDGLVIHIGDVNIAADIGHRAVVAKDSIVPASAFESGSAVTEAIVDAAIEADLWAPIAFIKDERTAAPTPVTGGPEQADSGRLHPGARHPVIAVRTISPIAGSPQISGRGNRWLRVDGERRWADRDRHADLRKNGGRNRDDQQG